MGANIAFREGKGLVDSRVRPGVSHGQKTGAAVLDLEVLVGKFLTVDGFSAGALSEYSDCMLVFARFQSRRRSTRRYESLRKSWKMMCAWITHVATGKIATLKHEFGNHAVEFRALVSIAFRAGAEGEEVLGGFGDGLVVELEVDSALLA